VGVLESLDSLLVGKMLVMQCSIVCLHSLRPALTHIHLQEQEGSLYDVCFYLRNPWKIIWELVPTNGTKEGDQVLENHLGTGSN
jgi:predicted membrane-bound dolichyl-phosphate-mannose-protein mannosyltransferase